MQLNLPKTNRLLDLPISTTDRVSLACKDDSDDQQLKERGL